MNTFTKCPECHQSVEFSHHEGFIYGWISYHLDPNYNGPDKWIRGTLCPASWRRLPTQRTLAKYQDQE